MRDFALIHTAIYDAMIAACDSKYAYNRKRSSEIDPGLATELPIPLFRGNDELAFDITGIIFRVRVSLLLDHSGQAAVDAACIAFKNLRLVRCRQRQLVDVALGVVVVVTRLRIDAAHRTDHLGGEQDVVDRDHLRQQFLTGQVIDTGIEEYVLQHDLRQQPELGVLRQTAVAPPVIGYRTAAMRNDELDG